MSYENFVRVKVVTPVTAGATSFAVEAAVAPNRLPPTDGGYLVVCDSPGNPSWVEIIKYTSRASLGISGVTRAQGGTTAVAWSGNVYAIQAMTAEEANLIQSTLADLVANKEPSLAAGTTAQYYRGDKTWRDLMTDVRAATLTGLSTATNAVISASDTVLSGLGKLQKQISDAATNLAANVRAVVLTGLVTTSNTAITATDSVLVALGKAQAQINDKQPLNTRLTSAAGLVMAVNDMLIADSTTTLAKLATGATGRSLLTSATAADGRTALALGTAATFDATTGQTAGSVSIPVTSLVRGAEAVFASRALYGHYVNSAGVNLDNEPAGAVGLYSSACGGTLPSLLGGSFWWVETQLTYTGSSRFQRAISYAGGSTSGPNLNIREALRLCNQPGTVWGPWVEVYNTLTPLTGYAVGSNAAVAATDTVLSALGKLQGQIDAAANGLATSVRSTALTGLSTATNSAVVATDTVLSGIGKLQAQVSDIISSFAADVRSTVLTGLSTVTATAAVATDTVLVAIGKLQAQVSARLPLAGGTLSGALNEAPLVTVASAATVNLGAAASNIVSITGTTTITSFGTIASGSRCKVVFNAALTLTHSTNLQLPGSANITTAAGDLAEFVSFGSGQWRCTMYLPADGQAVRVTDIAHGGTGATSQSAAQTALGLVPDETAGVSNLVKRNSSGGISVRFAEVGNLGVANTAYLDFHSSANSIDYDSRIAATGGSATIGQGTLTYSAGTHAFAGPVTMNTTLVVSQTVNGIGGVYDNGQRCWSPLNFNPNDKLSGAGYTGNSGKYNVVLGGQYDAYTAANQVYNGALELRENGLVTNGGPSPGHIFNGPGLSFHWGSVAVNKLMMNSSGHLCWGNPNGAINVTYSRVLTEAQLSASLATVMDCTIVGGLANLKNKAGAAIGLNVVVSSANLAWSDNSGNDYGAPTSGTWKSLGYVNPNNVGLFMRIS